jgi:hypothetical protein
MFIINRFPTPVLHHISPYEKLFHKPPAYTFLRVFGCKCFPLLRPYTAHKLEYRSKVCIFLGYSNAGYRCLDPITGRVYLSRNVAFDEHSFPAKENDSKSSLPSRTSAASPISLTSPVSSSNILPTNETSTEPTASASHPNPSHLTTPCPDQPEILQSSSLHSHTGTTTNSPITESSDHVATPFDSQLHLSTPLSHPSIFSNTTPTSTSNAAPTHPMITRSHTTVTTTTSSESSLPPAFPSHSMVTRSRTRSLKPKTFSDYKLYSTIKHQPPKALLTVLTESEPTSFAKAILDPRWQTAMAAEFAALQANKTWTLCDDPFFFFLSTNTFFFNTNIKQVVTVARLFFA